jgi:rod shape-determining protein MreD
MSWTGLGAKASLRVIGLLVVGIFLQTTFGPDLRAGGVAPDLMMLLAVCAGVSGGPEQGAIVGFGAGIVSDLFLQSTPFGLSVLAACLAGYVAGWARANLLGPSIVVTPVVAAAGTVFGVLAFAVIGYLVGQSQLVAPGKGWLLEIAAVEAVYAVLLALPVTALMTWALRGPSGARAPLGDGPNEGLPDLPSHRQSAQARLRYRSAGGARVR